MKKHMKYIIFSSTFIKNEYTKNQEIKTKC